MTMFTTNTIANNLLEIITEGRSREKGFQASKSQWLEYCSQGKKMCNQILHVLEIIINSDRSLKAEGLKVMYQKAWANFTEIEKAIKASNGNAT